MKTIELSLHAECVTLGIPTQHHASDLYIPVTNQTYELLKKHGKKATVFTNQVEGGQWYDVPFAYEPFFDKARADAADAGRAYDQHLASGGSEPD